MRTFTLFLFASVTVGLYGQQSLEGKWQGVLRLREDSRIPVVIEKADAGYQAAFYSY